MLETKNITYGYQNDQLLISNYDLTIQPGEVVGMFGFSGAGKTTLAKIIAGYIEPHIGEILINGEKLQQNSGFVHPVQLIWQHPEKAVNPKWQLKEILQEVGKIDGRLLSDLGIGNGWFQRRPHELSGGELQRICVARALSVNPQYVIADEMTTMLDAITQAQIWHTVLNYIKTRKIGVLAISHDQDLLKNISDRIIDFTRPVC